jgi:hypothetical protein
MLPMLLNISQDYNDDSQLLRNNVVNKEIILNSWRDKNEDKINTCIFIEQEEQSDRWIDLHLKFNDSFKQKKHL